MGVDASKPEFFAPLGSTPESRNKQILLYPDSDFGSNHEWPLDRWQEIARRLIDAGKKPLVICIEEGRRLGARLADALGDEVDRQSLAAPANAFGLFSDHRMLIAADGSAPHLASHFGATCVVLFGPNDPNWKRPLGKRHAIVRHHVECAPCLLEKCPLDLRCQNELEIERVWSAIEKAIDAAN
jgi:heptosyltransferase-2